MTWKCYLTIFKAESPVHIGYRQIGILKTTRYYITGRAMWGAITANLTRALFSNPDPEDYQAVGNFVRENIRTTYFYPAIKKEVGPENWSKYEVDGYFVFLPEYTDKGMKFGNISKEKFEQMFIGSFVSTALEAKTKTAEEGSLHEFEYVRNKIISSDKVIQVYWMGYLFINHNANKAKDNQERKVYKVELRGEEDDIIINFKNENTSLKDVLNLLFVGGERNYGFGKITLESAGFRPENQRLFGKFTLELDAEEPVIEIDTAFAHLDIELKGKLLGEIEPVVGLEWSDKGAGQSISRAIICITPGSKISGKYVLGEYCIINTQ
jgi:hypothetical protein